MKPPKDMTAEERNKAVCEIFVMGATQVAAIGLTEVAGNLLMSIGIPKSISDVVVYPLMAFLGGIVGAIILGVMNSIRNNRRGAHLHMQLIAQGNVVLQGQIVQNWGILAQGNYYLAQEAMRFEQTKNQTEQTLKDGAAENERQLDATDVVIERLRRYR